MRRIVTAISLLFATPAYAQVIPCSDTAELKSHLESQYGEHPSGAGISKNRIVSIHVDPKDGSWTVLRTYPNGTSCVIGAGTNWQSIKLPNTDPEA